MNRTTHEEEKKIDVPFSFRLSVSESTSDTYKMYSTFDERETNNLPDVSVEPETSFVTSAKRFERFETFFPQNTALMTDLSSSRQTTFAMCGVRFCDILNRFLL
jgi:predicted phosphoadenosine phosphosulfate sulfurtransferase